jgi:hypothetical protein
LARRKSVRRTIQVKSASPRFLHPCARAISVCPCDAHTLEKQRRAPGSPPSPLSEIILRLRENGV